MQDSVDHLADPGNLQQKDVVFPGFDGNGELRFIVYAKFMMSDDKFNGLRCVGGLNCHHETTVRYLRMLDKYESFPPERRRELSAAEIRSILEN